MAPLPWIPLSIAVTSRCSDRTGRATAAVDLHLEGLSHHYDGTEVLRDINLTIPAGRIICIVGPSGCGKSTLLRILGGLERPSTGHVRQVGPAPADSLNPITFVFQDFALLPWRSVEKNVSLVLEDHALTHDRRRTIIADVLNRTNLSDFRQALPKQLSGGMKQRVAIARALAVNPSIMLLDEPLSALDSQTRELLMDDLIGLWTRSPFTAVYVTHNLAEAVRLGHAIVVLSRRPGEIREILEINKPLAQRSFADPDLDAHQHHLWTVMRAEARAADTELLHV